MYRLEGRQVALVDVLVSAAVVGCAGYALFTLVDAVLSPTLATPISLHLDPAPYVGELPVGAVELDSATGLTAVESSLVARLSWWVFSGARGFVLAAGLELLRRIIASRTDPFIALNVSRLRGITGCAVAFETIELLRGPVDVVLARQIGFGEIATDEYLVAPVIIAVFAAVLAQAWETGISLRSETELTI